MLFLRILDDTPIQKEFVFENTCLNKFLPSYAENVWVDLVKIDQDLFLNVN